MESDHEDDVEDGNSTDSTELYDDNDTIHTDEEVIEARNTRLHFKIGKVGNHSNHVADNHRNHALAEEVGNTMVDSDDESIPEFMDEEDDSDQCFGSGNSTESEGSVFEGEDFQPITKERKYYYKQPNDPRDIHFEAGQIFLTREQFKNAVNEYSLSTKKDIRFIRNERKAVSVVCASAIGCNWRIWLGYSKKDCLYHISSMYPKHKCGKSFKSKRINAKWIAKKYFSRFRTQPNWKLDDIKQEIFATYEVSVSQNMCMKARKIARNDLVGDMVEHYAKLWDYKEELDKTNPGSTFEVRYVGGTQGEPRYFKGMYICFESLKRGFLNGCRPCIGLDGCFLKGLQRGQLLTCVGRDANDQMYPVAWAVVQVENNDTWSWFLRLLILDLEMIDGGQGWTLITDQQKGLVPAIAELLPNAEHRMCARHIFSNWHKVFKGGNLRMLFWQIAKSSTMQEMDKNFEKLKEIDENAYEDLKERGVQHWCRAHFNTDCKVASVDNNLAEAWNWSLVELRGKPIIYMLEDIRRSLMERIHKRRDWMYKKEIVVCPRIVKKLRQTADNIKYWSVHQNGSSLFEVIKGNEGFVVDTLHATCTCRMFQLEGLPCVHTMAALQHVGENPENHVSSFFKKDSFMQTYSPLINPLSGEEQWSHVNKEPLLPPPTRRMPGRPRKKRVRDTTETKVVKGNHILRKRGSILSCTICKGKGHNRRTCDKKDYRDVPPKTSARRADKDKAKSKCVYAKQRNKKRTKPKVVPTTSTTRSVGIEVNTQRSQVDSSLV